MNLGGLAGLSGAYGGYQEAESNDLRNRLLRAQAGKSEYELGGMQGGDAVASNTLRTIFGPGGTGIGGLGGIGQGPQGSSPMGVSPQGPQMAPQQPQPTVSGGGPTTMDPRIAQTFGDVRQSPGGYGGGPMAPSGAGPQTIAAIRAANQGAGNPQMTPPVPPPQQPPGPRGQPVGVVQMPQMMDWRSLFQAAIKSNPGASPQALIRGVDGLVHLLNPIERAQWMEQRALLSMMLGMGKLELGREQLEQRESQFGRRQEQQESQFERREEGQESRFGRRMDLGERNLEERKSQFNRREAAGGLGPRSAIGQYLQQFRSDYQKQYGKEPSADDLKRAAQNYHSEQVAMSRFFSGDRSKVIAALDNVVGHLGTLKKLGEAWAAGDIQTFNNLGAMWAAEFGGSAPTNIQTAGAIVGPEVLKALNVAQAGTGEERQQIKNIFDTAKSPEQFNQAIDVARKLLSRQFRTQRRQFQVATGLPAERFDAMLSPDVRPYLDEEEGAAPLKQGGGFSVGAPVQ